MHQCNDIIVPMHYFNLVQVDHTHNCNTRHAFRINFLQNYVRTELGKKTISSIGPKIWSKIPRNVKLCGIHKLKKEYKKFLVNQYRLKQYDD